MNDAAMPHVDFIAKLELDSIFRLIASDPQSGMLMFMEFLNNVHILETCGLESFTNETIPTLENSQAEESQKENVGETG